MDRKEAIKVLEMFLHKQCSLGRTEFAYDANAVWDAVKMATESLKTDEMYQLLFEDPDRVIIIPEDATNGDAILAVFPDTEQYHNNGIINTDIDDGTLFNADWWEAPYKRGNADDSDNN